MVEKRRAGESVAIWGGYDSYRGAGVSDFQSYLVGAGLSLQSYWLMRHREMSINDLSTYEYTFYIKYLQANGI